MDKHTFDEIEAIWSPISLFVKTVADDDIFWDGLTKIIKRTVSVFGEAGMGKEDLISFLAHVAANSNMKVTKVEGK